MDQPPRGTVGPPLAGEVYAVELAAHTGRKGVRRLAFTLLFLVSSVAMGEAGGPSVGDVVVRRRTDGREVIRFDAGMEEEAALQVSQLREQLATLTAEEFCERWEIDPNA